VPAESEVDLSHPTNAKQATNANNATSLIVYFFVCSFCLPPCTSRMALRRIICKSAFGCQVLFCSGFSLSKFCLLVSLTTAGWA